MRRKILIGGLAGLAAICLGLGVWSHWWVDVVQSFRIDGRFFQAVTNHGSLIIVLGNHAGFPSQGWVFTQFPNSPSNAQQIHMGFHLFWDKNEKAIGAPLWLIAAMLIFIAWRIHRRRANPPGLCAHCGYDLRATPESSGQLLEVCPECGRPAGVAPVG